MRTAASSTRTKRFFKRLATPGLTLFYLLILLEGFYMTSAFAIYLFSTYAPIQSALESCPATSWLTDFYLSHFIDWSAGPSGVSAGSAQVETVALNPLRQLLRSISPGEYCAIGGVRCRYFIWYVGFFLFFAGAIPVYYAKLTRRGAITGGLYRFIRHPQYLGFAIIGIPFLVLWPRFILLLAYVSMLYFYYMLAHREEKLCLEKFGEAYRAYLDRTSMFVPGDALILRRLQARFNKVAPSTTIRHIVFLVLVYLLILGVTTTGAYALKHYTVRHLPHVFDRETLAIALKNSDRLRLADLLALAQSEQRVSQKIAQARTQGLNTWLVYLLPMDYQGVHFFVDHFPKTRPKEEWTGRWTPAYDVAQGIESIPRDQLRMLLFWGTETPAAQTAQELLDRYLRLQPLLILGIDLRSRKIVGVVELQALEDAKDPYRGSRMPLF